MSEAAQFVARFEAFWRRPSGESIGQLLHPDVVLRQPLMPTLHGLSQAEAGFRRLLTLVPDLSAVVEGWFHQGERVGIEFRLRGHLGAAPFDLPTVDIFYLRADRAYRRDTFMDPTPLYRAAWAQPGVWWRWWRHGRRAAQLPAGSMSSGRSQSRKAARSASSRGSSCTCNRPNRD